MLPAIEQIVQAIQHLHAHPTENHDVNRQLMELLRLREAWAICMPLLDYAHDVNVQFFGAHTLQVKISTDWYVYRYIALQLMIIGIHWKTSLESSHSYFICYCVSQLSRLSCYESCVWP